jgi:tetratricopeptide (TPR) repeat protein
VELDPLSLSINRGLGYVYFELRQYDKAIDQERKTLEMDPNYSPAHSILGRAYLEKGMYNEAIAEFDKENNESMSNLGRAYAMAGRRAEAQKTLDQMLTQSKQTYVAPKFLALTYAALGEKDKAFEWLEKSYQDRSICVAVGLKSFPGYDPLRSDPRFAALLRRINLQP